MTVITPEIMKYYQNFFSQFKINIMTPMNRTSVFSCCMTMISYICRLHQITYEDMNKFLLKCLSITFLQYSYSPRIVLINLLSEFFSAVKNNWFTSFIINTNNFVSKTARNIGIVVDIFQCMKNYYFYHYS